MCHEIGRAYALALISFLLPPEPCRKLEQSTEHSGAIIVHQLDETGFLNQPSELDKMTCACPPILHPLPLVITGLIAIEAVTQHGQAF